MKGENHCFTWYFEKMVTFHLCSIILVKSNALINCSTFLVFIVCTFNENGPMYVFTEFLCYKIVVVFHFITTHISFKLPDSHCSLLCIFLLFVQVSLTFININVTIMINYCMNTFRMFADCSD